jgi:haloalkane dehalogenase
LTPRRFPTTGHGPGRPDGHARPAPRAARGAGASRHARAALVAVAIAAAVSLMPATALAKVAKLVWVPRAGHRIAAYVQPGRGPAIVLCHGFPDNHHLYDRVVPLLRGREVVTFDFLGWGHSSKPSRYRYTFAGQEADLDAVIRSLHLSRVVLVAHDASVPAVLNWTLDHPRRVVSTILSNGFYAPVPGSSPPPLAAIFAFGQYPTTAPLGPLPAGTAAGFRSLMQGLAHDRQLLKAFLDWQESTFFADPRVARTYTPLFTGQFLARPSSLGPLASLAGNLFAAVAGDAARLTSLRSLTVPVHIVWGAHDSNLGLNVARYLHRHIPTSTLTVLPHAHHYLMFDDPRAFAAAITQAAAGESVRSGAPLAPPAHHRPGATS